LFDVYLILLIKKVIMKKTTPQEPTPRRSFLGALATGAAALGLATFAKPLRLTAAPTPENSHPGLTPRGSQLSAPGSFSPGDPDAWFSQIKGKHRLIVDVTKPNEMMPFAWPKIFLLTNIATGTPEKDNNVVVVFRHEGIPFAFNDSIWSKYKFGEVFKFDDPKTKKPATRNPFWKPSPGDFQAPGIGSLDIGIDSLQNSGVMFCVCDIAMTVYSAALASGANPADVKKEWMAGLLPGIQPVPSGIWAVGRAQEHGCSYAFAG
jgi:intracellular sulfur oxidation DsrE/DsrF family protein